MRRDGLTRVQRKRLFAERSERGQTAISELIKRAGQVLRAAKSDGDLTTLPTSTIEELRAAMLVLVNAADEHD